MMDIRSVRLERRCQLLRTSTVPANRYGVHVRVQQQMCLERTSELRRCCCVERTRLHARVLSSEDLRARFVFVSPLVPRRGGTGDR
jgi:hypothetical protein